MLDLLYLKIFLRRNDTSHSILIIALLAAMLASAYSINSFLNAQIEALASLREPAGKKYVILGGESISNSRLNPLLADSLRSLQHIGNVTAERIFWSNVSVGPIRFESLVRGVSNVKEFLSMRKAYLNGSAATNMAEAVIGELVSKAYSIGIGSKIHLTYNGRSLILTVTGLFRTQTEIDSEIIVPIVAAFNLTCEEEASLIEFSLKAGADVSEALKEVAGLLPRDARIVCTQQPTLFARQINTQIIRFLAFWSLAVHAVVASASYIIATRLIEETSYEIRMLMALGARRLSIFTLIISYIIIVATSGSILGSALGLIGTQMISAALSWLTPSIRIAPFLEPQQALQILLTTIFSAIMGCIPPAHRAAKMKYTERLL